MDASREHPIRRIEDGLARAAADPVVEEVRVELDVNDGQGRLAMLCLPADLEALAVGFLLAEGVLRSVDDLQSVQVSLSESRIVVKGDCDADALENLSRRWTWGTGCGSGGTGRDVDAPAYAAAGEGPVLSPARLLELSKAFHHGTPLWRQTGGVHACGLADAERVILTAEDVGRHNAFDKVIGMAAMKRIPLTDKLVLTTGRLSGEIVSKALACGVAMLASRSAVTSLAIRLARRFGMTLVGFLRGGRMNVYTGFQRIVADEAAGQEGQP